MQLARDAAEAWLDALVPGGLPAGKVRAAADALAEVEVLGRMLLRDLRVTPEPPASHARVTPEPPPVAEPASAELPAAEVHVPEVVVMRREVPIPMPEPPPRPERRRRAKHGGIDWTEHPLGLLPETQIERVTGITQSTVSKAVRTAGHPPKKTKTHSSERWAPLLAAWGEHRVLAWFDAHGKGPAAAQLREQFVAYVASREPQTAPTPAGDAPAADEEDEPEPEPGPRGRRRATTIAATRLSRVEMAAGAALIDTWAPMPKTRGECAAVPRPCPFVACRHHLAVEVTSVGGLTLVHGHDDVTEIEHTCSLDLADREGMTLEEVAGALAITRERVRQIEAMALKKMREAGVGLGA